MTINELNFLSQHEAKAQFSLFCGADNWVEKMVVARPFKNINDLMVVAEKSWFSLPKESWLEAFDHHPKIGNINSLRKKFEKKAVLSKSEQKGIENAPEDVLLKLAEGNRLYEERFGYIFIVCASGKTAEEMFAMLNRRLSNTPDEEIHIAASEQNKITRLRIKKLIKP